MIRRLPLLLSLALVALIVGAAIVLRPAAGPQVYAPQGQGDLYLALGDSLAWGFRLDNPGSESYPALIHADLARRGPIALANLSVPGATTGSLLEGQLPRAVELIGEQRRAGRRVSPITLDIGGNDLRAAEQAPTAERAATVERARVNIGRTLDALREAAGPDADLAIMTYYNPYGGDARQQGSEAYWVEQLNAAIREEAARRGVAVADVYPAFEGGRAYTHTFILFGDIHANAQGHTLIARVFLDALSYKEPGS